MDSWHFVLFGLILYVPVNIFLVTFGWGFLGLTSTKQSINAVPPVKLKPATPQSEVKYSTTEWLRSSGFNGWIKTCVGPDQLASSEARWSGSALLKYFSYNFKWKMYKVCLFSQIKYVSTYKSILTLCILETLNRYFGKHWKPRWNAVFSFPECE